MKSVSAVSQAIFKRCAVAIVLWFLCTLVVSVTQELNREYGSTVVWYPLLLFIFAVALLAWPETEPADKSSMSARPKLSHVAILGILLLAVNVTLSGWKELVAGALTLKGDALKEPEAFRNAHSLSYVVIAGIIEEVCARRHCQVPLASEVGKRTALFVSSCTFLVFHVFTAMTGKYFVFVLLMAASTGYLVYRGGTIRQAAALHSIVNGVPVAAVLLARKFGAG